MTVNLKKEVSKSGDWTVKVDGLYLHSKYNPKKEAETVIANEYKPHHLHVLFGVGMGYVLEALIEKFQFNEPVLVLDPLLDSGLLDFPNISYARLYRADSTKVADIVEHFEQLSSYSMNLHFITSMNYDKLFPSELKDILNLVKNHQYKQGSNLATAKHFALHWQTNLLLNTPNLVRDTSLDVLQNVYSCPVVVAAGGPSLTKQVPLLKQYRNNIIVICAGSTINALLKHNIQPDYVVSVDGGEPNAKHFESLELDEKVSLIYGPTNHYKVREVFNAECYTFIPSVKPQYQAYFRKRFSQSMPLIDGGGSVAHYALTIAKFMTTGPIAIIGQDLALTNRESHAEGVRGKSDAIALDNKELFEVEGYYGEKVQTTQSLFIMLNSFNEPPLLDVERKNVWNCTEGGAKIKSIAQMSFKDFLEQFAQQENEKIYPPLAKKSIKLQTKAFLQEELKHYQKILAILQKGLRLIHDSKAPRLTSKELDQIGKLEKELNKLYKQYCLETLLEPIFDRCSHEYLPQLNETKEEALSRAKNYAQDLYESCANQIQTLMDQLTAKENEEHDNN